MNDLTVAHRGGLVNRADLIQSEPVLEELLPYIWPLLRQIGQVQDYVDALLLDGEVEDVSVAFELQARQIVQRYPQSIDHCSVVVHHRVLQAFVQREVLCCDVGSSYVAV